MKPNEKDYKKITDYFHKKNVPPLQRILKPQKSPLDLPNKKREAHKNNKEIKNKDRDQDKLSNGTVVIEQQNQENFQSKVCKQLIMIGPCDVSYYFSVQSKLKSVRESYSKANFMKYLFDNARYNGAHNLNILNEIKDNEFWQKTVPRIIDYALDKNKQKSISCTVGVLVSGNPNLVELSKAQVLMILINMLLCTLPRQSCRDYLNFAWLMGERDRERDSSKSIKLQKLKCFVNYFNVMLRRDYSQLEKEQICFQRVKQSVSRAQLKSSTQPFTEVVISRGFIEDHYKQAIMIDFANKNIGGGVLAGGAVQEEILFCVFPELVALMCLCEEMGDSEALVVVGAERLSNYSGYSEDFRFEGEYNKGEEACKFPSIFVAIDAINYSQKISKESQYVSHAIYRQIGKAVVGIEGAQVLADSEMPVCTGRWGCGAFKGDIYLKFLIQWVACSIASRRMIYKAQDPQEQRQLAVMVDFIRKLDIGDLLEAIEEYQVVLKKARKLSFLQYLKREVL